MQINEQEARALKQLYKLGAGKQLCQALFGSILTKGQVDIFNSIAFPITKRTVITCPTRYGKSWTVSQAALTWIASAKNKKLVVIAPTNEKTAIIRNYIAYFISSSLIFSELVDMEKSGISRIRKEVSKKRMTFKNGVELRTLSAEGKGDALMGWGGDKIIADEECDIDYEVYRSKITRMLGESPDSEYVGIGNPWHKLNQMWEHCINPDWQKIHIGWQQAVQEGRFTQSFIDEQKSQLTPMEFKILYEAEFPDSATDALIEWEWIDKATKKEETFPGEVMIGIDIAEQGNDLTVVTVVIKEPLTSRYRVVEIQSWGKTDLMPTVAKILPIIDKYKTSKVSIDATGVGSGVYSRLEELKREGRLKCIVNAFKGGLSPTKEDDKQRFLNMKSESYWHLRSLFEAGKIQIPKHRELINQLSKMKSELTSSEKIRIRDPGTKEGDTAEEKSPDFSDSLNIAVWHGGRSALIFQHVSMSDKTIPEKWGIAIK